MVASVSPAAASGGRGSGGGRSGEPGGTWELLGEGTGDGRHGAARGFRRHPRPISHSRHTVRGNYRAVVPAIEACGPGRAGRRRGRRRRAVRRPRPAARPRPPPPARPSRGRRSATVATTKARAANVAEVRNAARTPGRNSPGTAPAAYTETMAATPIALPSCWRGLEQAGGRAGVLRVDVGQRGRGDRHEHQAGGEAVEQHRAEDRAEVAVARPDAGEQHEAGRQAERAGHHQRAGADPAPPGAG